MNVLVIAELFPPDMSGGSMRAFNVVKGLISLGHKVTVVAAFLAILWVIFRGIEVGSSEENGSCRRRRGPSEPLKYSVVIE